MQLVNRIKSLFIGNSKETVTPQSRRFESYNSLTFRKTGLTFAQYYNRVPELRSIVDQQADMFNKIKLSGNKRAIKKLQNPNYLQTGNEFFAMAYKQFSLYSVVFMYFDFPAGFEDSELKIDNSELFIIPYDNLLFEYFTASPQQIIYASDLKNVIKKVWYIENGKKTELKIDNLLIINEAGISLTDAITGNSRLNAARDCLDNLLAIAESKNVYTYHRGAIGIFSPENPRTDTTIFTEDDKNNVDEALLKYGTLENQRQYIVVPYPVRFQKTVLSPKELDFDSMILREKINLSDLLGHNILLLNETAGATFSNYETARKIIYENRIIPVFNTIISGLNSIFNLEGAKQLFADITEIEALQADKKLKAEIDKMTIENIVNVNNNLRNGTITYDVALTLMQALGYTLEESTRLLNEINIQANEIRANI